MREPYALPDRSEIAEANAGSCSGVTDVDVLSLNIRTQAAHFRIRLFRQFVVIERKSSRRE